MWFRSVFVLLLYFFVCFSIHFRGKASKLFNWNHRVLSCTSMRCLLHVSQTFFLGICVFRIIVPSLNIVSLIFWKFPLPSCNDPSLKSTLPHDNIVMLPFSCLHLDCVWSCFYFQYIALHLNDIDCPGYRKMEVLLLLPHHNEHHSNKDHISYTFLLLFIHICMQMEPMCSASTLPPNNIPNSTYIPFCMSDFISLQCETLSLIFSSFNSVQDKFLHILLCRNALC